MPSDSASDPVVPMSSRRVERLAPRDDADMTDNPVRTVAHRPSRLPRGREAVLTPADIASALRVSDRTVQRWLAAGRIPGGARVGGVWRVDAETFYRWLEDQETRADV